MKKIMIILIVILIFLTSCTSQNKEITVFKCDQIDGLRVTVIDGTPPSQIYSGSEENPIMFSVGAKINNIGCYDLGQDSGYVSISYDPEINQLISQNPIQLDYSALYGGSIITKKTGGEDTAVFTLQNNKYPPSGSSPIKLNVCYKYRTKFITDICINPKKYLGEGSKLKNSCDFEKYAKQSFSGQGAPIVISNVDTSIIPIGTNEFNLIFKIKVVNKGEGRPTIQNSFKKQCLPQSQSVLYDELNTVELTGISVAGKSLGNQIKCQPEKDGKIQLRLDNNINYFTCQAKVDRIYDDFMTPLSIQLDYGYVIQKTPIFSYLQP